MIIVHVCLNGTIDLVYIIKIRCKKSFKKVDHINCKKIAFKVLKGASLHHEG
jgi:hypothetical protein